MCVCVCCHLDLKSHVHVRACMVCVNISNSSCNCLRFGCIDFIVNRDLLLRINGVVVVEYDLNNNEFMNTGYKFDYLLSLN